MSTQTLTQRRTESAASTSVATDAAAGAAHKNDLVNIGGVSILRVPHAKPTFTIGDIRRAIPAHCFERPLTKSFGYLFADLVVVAVLFYATTFIPLVSDATFGATLAPVLRHVLWAAYWVCQGCVMTGLWVVGHECGHRGFADSELINDAVGLVVHSFLLVPYFAWQFSHKRHHSNTGSVEHDEVHVPVLATEAQRDAFAKKLAGENHEEYGFIEQTKDTLHRMFFIVVMLTVGWPAYLFANISGNKTYDPKAWVNHFFPESPIFTTGSESDAKNQKLILLGDIALIAVLAVFYKAIQATSLASFVYVFGVPYLIVNFWLVLITYLQHTDLALPHYTDGQWDWLRGALATVDRDYGAMVNMTLHHITDTHVVHHLFSSLPHYHAEEATRAVKSLLGDYYRYDNTPITTALWNCFRDCSELHPDPKTNGVHWFMPRL